MNRVAVIGGSAGGLLAVEALRRTGFDGAITLIGDEPHLPYDRPPLSKQILNGQWAADRVTLRPRAAIDALGVDLRLGLAATGLDADAHTVRLADGTDLPYEGLIVATGVRARGLPGAEGVKGVHTLRTLDDALALRARLRPGRRLVVVGAGFVGAEVAAVARVLGADVTVLEAGPVPMELAIGRHAGLFLAGLHEENGVHIRTEAVVTEVVGADGEVAAVVLADGEVVPADDLLIAIGSTPNTEWLADCGLDVTNGLVCDEYCAAAPDVYGVGDVAAWHNPLFDTTMRVEHRTNAAEQALAAAGNLFARDARRPYAPVPYVWSDQYDAKVQTYGYLRDHDEELVLENSPAQRRLLVAYRRGGRLTGVLAVGEPPRVVRAWRALIASGAAWKTAISGTAAA